MMTIMFRNRKEKSDLEKREKERERNSFLPARFLASVLRTRAAATAMMAISSTAQEEQEQDAQQSKHSAW